MSTLRQKIQSIVITAIVVLISLIFILQFGGPQSQGCSGGRSAYAARVYGETISVGELTAALRLANEGRYSPAVARQMQFREKVLQGLIERNLLAREARMLGFSVSEEDVMRHLAEKSVLYVSAPVGASPSLMPSGPLPVDLTDKDGKFSTENARRFIQNRLGRSVQEFAEAQIQETLAQRMRETYAATVQISPTAPWEAYEQERDRAKLKYVRFAAAHYRQGLKPTRDEIKAWVEAHKDAVEAEYDKQKHRYTGLEKQVRARHILIKPDGDDDAAKQQAKQRAERLREQALGGADFAALAREHSQDPGSAKKGGDLGYNPRGRMVAPFDEAQFALKEGEISDVVETQFGFHVIKVEDIREGDVPLEEAHLEIGEKLYVEARAGELAKAAAERALAALKAGKSFEQLEEELKAGPGQGEAAGEGDGSKSASPLAPAVKETRLFGRSDTPIPGVEAGDLVKVAFELTTEAPLAKAPVKAGQDWFVVRLEERQVPKREEFEGAEERRLREALLFRKRSELLDRHITRLREQAEAEGQIRINPDAVSYPGTAPLG